VPVLAIRSLSFSQSHDILSRHISLLKSAKTSAFPQREMKHATGMKRSPFCPIFVTVCCRCCIISTEIRFEMCSWTSRLSAKSQRNIQRRVATEIKTTSNHDNFNRTLTHYELTDNAIVVAKDLLIAHEYIDLIPHAEIRWNYLLIFSRNPSYFGLTCTHLK